VEIIIIPVLFLISVIGTLGYKKISVSNQVLARPNHRTLHKYSIPIGGGIVFSIVSVLSVLFIWWKYQLSEELLWVLGAGGLFSSLFGFLDDIIDIKASIKLVVQVLLSCWTVYWLDVNELLLFEWLPEYFSIPLVTFLLVWMINGYNFMDGVDGMAASGAIFVSLTLALVMFLTVCNAEIIYVFIFLATTVSGFIIFNWPPASIFMGDAGSIFLGYTFGALLLFTVTSGDLSIWTWLVAFGYFFSDTLVTQIARVLLVEKWYRAHRSHAYQNLARITGSHLKVTGGVILYNIVWILPLTLWSAMKPETALVAVVLAITPVLVFAFKFGPVLSSS